MQLIFLHGSGGCKESWRFQLDYFENAIALDFPGHPQGELCATVDEYARWLHETIVASQMRDVVLVGHSMGGGVALQAALDYPDHLRAVVTVGSGARLRVHPDIFSMLEPAREDATVLDQFLDLALARIDPDLSGTMRARSHENTVAAFLNDFSACDGFDVMDRLADLSIPLLAAVGSQDGMAPVKYSEYLASSVQSGRICLIDGADHYAHIEQPAIFNESLAAFCRSLL